MSLHVQSISFLFKDLPLVEKPIRGEGKMLDQVGLTEPPSNAHGWF
jgi:hypothetical protein